jgi:hypothetical protein
MHIPGYSENRKKIDVETEIRLIQSSVVSKAEPSVTVESDDGSVSEVPSSEYQNERVNLLYNETVEWNRVSNNPTHTGKFANPGQSVENGPEDIDYDLIDPMGASAIFDKNSEFIGSAPDYSKIALRPAHAFMQDQGSLRRPTFLNPFYGAQFPQMPLSMASFFGIYGKLATPTKAGLIPWKVSSSWASNIIAAFNSRSTRDRGYINQHGLDKKLQNLSDTMRRRGIDVIITKYWENLVPVDPTVVNVYDPDIVIDVPKETATDPLTYKYYRDTNYSFIKKKTDDHTTHSQDSENALYQFINNQRLHGNDLFNTKTADQISIADVSIKEAMIALIGDREFFRNEISEILEQLEDSNTLIDSFVSTNSQQNGYLHSAVSTSQSAMTATTSLSDIVRINTTLTINNTLYDISSAIRKTFGIISNFRMQIAIMSSIDYSAAATYSSLIDATDDLYDDLSSAMSKIRGVIANIKLFEAYAGESVLDGGNSIFDKSGEFTIPVDTYGLYRHMAWLMIPVNFSYSKKYRKEMRKKKIPKNLGIRWVEIKFVNTNPLSQFPPNQTVTGQIVGINSPIESVVITMTGSAATVVLTTKFNNPKFDPGAIVGVQINGCANPYIDGTWENAHIIDARTITWTTTSLRHATASKYGEGGIVLNLIIPYPKQSAPDAPVTLLTAANIPYLPSDAAIAEATFKEYGAFNNVNPSDPNYIPGWNPFPVTSSQIKDMHPGIDIYEKTQFLLSILKSEFGDSRIKIIETSRSVSDQDIKQTGGEPSTFLSWHNFGLSIRINIYASNKTDLIKEGTDDYFRLLDIAEAFISGASQGDYGTPFNVVWGSQLATGPDMFVWEFLPIGIGHKDSVIFRDSILNQMDPFQVVVPIDSTKYLRKEAPKKPVIGTDPELLDQELTTALSKLYASSNDMTEISEVATAVAFLRGRTDSDSIIMKRNYLNAIYNAIPGIPYILESDDNYKSALSINGLKYIKPEYITNYQFKSNLLLRNIGDFIYLIDRKFAANGTTLPEGMDVLTWRMHNPISFVQLFIYNGLIGNYTVCRALLALDYYSRYAQLSASATDDVDFVRQFLGSEYYSPNLVKIKESSDGSFISLFDGHIYFPIMEGRSSFPGGNGNLFGGKQVSSESIQYGIIKNGVFIPRDSVYDRNDVMVVEGTPLPVVRSTEPVIAGYVDGEGITDRDSEAYLLHYLIRQKFQTEIENTKALFTGLSTKFLFDSWRNGQNANEFLENEFGTIQSQDIVPIGRLRGCLHKLFINTNELDQFGQIKKSNGNPIFEPLISGVWNSGVFKARMTQTKPVQDPASQNPVETIIRNLQNGNRAPDITKFA